MNVGRKIFTLLALCVAPLMTLGAQSTTASEKDSIVTPSGVCRVWRMPPRNANFPTDAAYNSCALDRKPKVISRAGLPPTVRRGQWMHAQYIVVVEPDGRVNDGLTRFHMNDAPPGFVESIRDSLSAWRFEPGILNGKPVRSALLINLTTLGNADNSRPYRLEWSYRATAAEDTLTATWIKDDSNGSLNAEQTENVYMSVIKELVRQNVLRRISFAWETQYCLVLPATDSLVLERINARALTALFGPASQLPYHQTYPFRFGNPGCERRTESKRIVMEGINATQYNSFSLAVSGDFLPHYPASLDGRSWRTWKGRCVGQVDGVRVVFMTCEVEPGDFYEYAAWSVARDENRAAFMRASNPVRTTGTDSARITATIYSANSMQLDTIRVTVGPIPSLGQLTLMDSVPRCNVVPVTSADMGAVFSIIGRPTDSSLTIRKVRPASPGEVRAGQCVSEALDGSGYLSFRLRGVDSLPDAPVNLNYLGVEKQPAADRAKYVLEMKPHLKFRAVDPLAGRRTGSAISMRLNVMTARQENIIPFAVCSSRGPGWQIVQPPTVSGVGSWDFNFHCAAGDDSWMYVYLVRRP